MMSKISSAEEEYIKVVSFLQGKNGRARTTDVANKLGVKPSSATEMLKRLNEKGLIEYKPYHGSTLTKEGKIIAKKLNTKYEVIKNFLQSIGIEEKIAAIDACNIEHILSPESVYHMKNMLNRKNERFNKNGC